MRINLVIEHDFAEAPEAASFLEAIALAVAKVQRAATFEAGYHATKPLVKAAPKPEPTEAEEAPAADEAPAETAEAKEKRKRRTKAEVEAARAAEAAAAVQPAPAAVEAPPVPTPAADVSLDTLREAVMAYLDKKGQPATAALLAPYKGVSAIPAGERAAYLAKAKAGL